MTANCRDGEENKKKQKKYTYGAFRTSAEGNNVTEKKRKGERERERERESNQTRRVFFSEERTKLMKWCVVAGGGVSP